VRVKQEAARLRNMKTDLNKYIQNEIKQKKYKDKEGVLAADESTIAAGFDYLKEQTYYQKAEIYDWNTMNDDEEFTFNMRFPR
jgi:regulatory protein YycH of two-component signal transduction system YycFG